MSDTDTAGIGHNQPPADPKLPTVGRDARQTLRSFVARVEKLQEDRAALSADIREVFAEAKASGLDAKTLRQVIALRKIDAAVRREQDHLRTLYLNALGMK